MKNETIVDRVVERLKSQPLGDLITEEDLHDIVKQAIPKVFFEERVIPSSGYGRPETKEPAIFEIMRETLRASAQKAVADWIAENAEQVAEYWKKVCDENLLTYVEKIQNERATQQVREALNGIFQRLNDERGKMGLPYIPLV